MHQALLIFKIKTQPAASPLGETDYPQLSCTVKPYSLAYRAENPVQCKVLGHNGAKQASGQVEISVGAGIAGTKGPKQSEWQPCRRQVPAYSRRRHSGHC